MQHLYFETYKDGLQFANFTDEWGTPCVVRMLDRSRLVLRVEGQHETGSSTILLTKELAKELGYALMHFADYGLPDPHLAHPTIHPLGTPKILTPPTHSCVFHGEYPGLECPACTEVDLMDVEQDA